VTADTTAAQHARWYLETIVKPTVTECVADPTRRAARNAALAKRMAGECVGGAAEHGSD
jgi:hypothetical protein